eukprot:4815902-Pleurochrysis_carterae.AAC.1
MPSDTRPPPVCPDDVPRLWVWLDYWSVPQAREPSMRPPSPLQPPSPPLKRERAGGRATTAPAVAATTAAATTDALAAKAARGESLPLRPRLLLFARD